MIDNSDVENRFGDNTWIKQHTATCKLMMVGSARADFRWSQRLLLLVVQLLLTGHLILDNVPNPGADLDCKRPRLIQLDYLVSLDLFQIPKKLDVGSEELAATQEHEGHLAQFGLTENAQAVHEIVVDNITASLDGEIGTVFGKGVIKFDGEVPQILDVLRADHLEKVKEVLITNLLWLGIPEWSASIVVSLERKTVLAVQDRTSFVMYELARPEELSRLTQA